MNKERRRTSIEEARMEEEHVKKAELKAKKATIRLTYQGIKTMPSKSPQTVHVSHQCQWHPPHQHN